MTDDIRQRHMICDNPGCRDESVDNPQHCHWCMHGYEEWPCDAIRMADERDEWEAHSRRWMEHAGKVATERDAANADAERLAEALRRSEVTLTAINPDENYPHAEARDMARAALAAHDARKEP